MTEPLVSVIVPIYNVEPYLPKCLDSLISQTYKNLEIILVDDGSPDNCGAICDEYAAKDSRVKVIHQPNGGLSAARNTGLGAAAGEWISWVDSDDWVDPDFIEFLLGNALENGAEIVTCRRYLEYPDKQVIYGPEERVLDSEAALELLLNDTELHNGLCNKLWRRELYRGVVFPEGRTYEDLAVAWKLYAGATLVVCRSDVKYHYFVRQGSIVHDTSLRNRMNWFLAAKERHDEMIERYPQFKDLLHCSCMWPAITLWTTYFDDPAPERKRLRPELHAAAQFMREHPPGEKYIASLGPTGRLNARLLKYDTWWAFAIAALMDKIYRLKHGKKL